MGNAVIDIKQVLISHEESDTVVVDARPVPLPVVASSALVISPIITAPFSNVVTSDEYPLRELLDLENVREVCELYVMKAVYWVEEMAASLVHLELDVGKGLKSVITLHAEFRTLGKSFLPVGLLIRPRWPGFVLPQSRWCLVLRSHSVRPSSWQ